MASTIALKYSISTVSPFCAVLSGFLGWHHGFCIVRTTMGYLKYRRKGQTLMNPRAKTNFLQHFKNRAKIDHSVNAICRPKRRSEPALKKSYASMRILKRENRKYCKNSPILTKIAFDFRKNGVCVIGVLNAYNKLRVWHCDNTSQNGQKYCFFFRKYVFFRSYISVI